jgi:hypothetical protein
MEWPLAQSATILKSGHWSFDHLDGDTLVVETHRYKDGHELAIVERISIQDKRLVYGHEITGRKVSASNARSSSTFLSAKHIRRAASYFLERRSSRPNTNVSGNFVPSLRDEH